MPFIWTNSRRGLTQCPFPDAVNKSAVSFVAWIRCGIPLPSKRDAVFTVSPKSWNLAFSPRRTPAVTGPECKPTRARNSPVDGPKYFSRSRVRRSILRRQTFANCAIITACCSLGLGKPHTATYESPIVSAGRESILGENFLAQTIGWISFKLKYLPTLKTPKAFAASSND